MTPAGTRSHTFWTTLKRWADAEFLHAHEDKVLLVLTLIIGAVVGLVVVAFILLTENLGARMYPAGGAAWRRLVIPVAGSLITGFLLYRYFPNARGSGIPQTKTALFIRDGYHQLSHGAGEVRLLLRCRWRAASRSAAKALRCRSAPASRRCSGGGLGLSPKQRQGPGAGRRVGGAGRGVQHAHRRRAVLARRSDGRPARAGARLDRAQLGHLVDGAAPAARR